MYKTVLIKLSGEALAGNQSVFDMNVLSDIASQIKEIVDAGVRVGIVVGGGNICRGRIFQDLGLDRVEADQIGMTATDVNAMMLVAALKSKDIKAKVMSAIELQFVESVDATKANKYLDEGYTLVFGGGVGKPYYSTDTGSAMRAADINAEVILMGKHGTDGVYDKDPRKYEDAKRFNELTFTDIINKKLEVIDLQAAEVCISKNIKAFVFDMASENAIAKAAKGQQTGTLIRV